MHVGDAGVFVGHECLRPPSFCEENFHRSPLGHVFGLTKRVFSLVLDPCILPVATWWCGAPTFGAAAGELPNTVGGQEHLIIQALVAKPST